MQKLRRIVEEIQSSTYCNPTGVYKEISDLIVVKWPKFSREEKLKVYYKYACHELNFYIFKKDNSFF